VCVVIIYFACYKMQLVERDWAAIENSVTRAAKDMGYFPMKPKQVEATHLFMQGNDMFEQDTANQPFMPCCQLPSTTIWVCRINIRV